jgi:nucleoid-associated protein YgaU
MKAICTIALIALVAAIAGCNDDGWSDQSNYDTVSHGSSAYDPADNTLGPTSAEDSTDDGMVPPLDSGTEPVATSGYPSREERQQSFEDAAAGRSSSSTYTPSGTTAVGGTQMYTIRRGDTLWGIAERRLGSGQRWREIADLNPGLDPARLSIGQEIVLPRN